jgi:hypothetical protein
MNAINPSVCPECGAPLREGKSCQQRFEELLALEFENPGGAGSVHHLTVLCYMLQHNQYSDEAAAWAQAALKAVLEDGLSPSQLRYRSRKPLDQTVRTWKVTGSTAVTRGLRWPVTISDVALGDAAGHNQRVMAWAQAVWQTLKTRDDTTRG